MKLLFEEKDIEAGLFVINNRSPLGSEDYSFAESVTWKICFKQTRRGVNYYLASVRDGMLTQKYTKEGLVKRLNKDDGFRILTKKEFLLQLENSKGMRLERFVI